MQAYRVDITAWTASFRYPNLISGVQPTLEVPPLSTVLGIINAASGKYLTHNNQEIGFYLEFAGKAFDLETIYMIQANSKGNPSNNAKANVLQREFLGDVKLSLYLTNEKLVSYLEKPYYDILLGRSGDLAMVSKPMEIRLEPNNAPTKIKGQIIPFEGNYLPGKIQALPQYFTSELPRRNLGTQPYSIIPHYMSDFPADIPTYRDPKQGENGVDIFFHTLKHSWDD